MDDAKDSASASAGGGSTMGDAMGDAAGGAAGRAGDERLGPSTDHQGHVTPPVEEQEEEVWAAGGTMFAGVLLLVTGVFGMLAGISGIGGDDVYGAVGEYTFKFDVNTWGWIHLILGVIVALAGIGILQGLAWASMVGIVLAVLVMVANFMWLPYQPIWAIIDIAIAAFVIWSLSHSLSRNGPR